ncbi:SpoIIE family protein phosphatase [Luteitalea sp.]|jgi:sigma-B regulation protein RsbU (phosphoserine phosphatase)|uniref:SpoIIE family protein phosphatase n=1 Tax=Luteitalea sp. TaxID=2004800 RepID=UPI0037C6BA15
MPPDSPGSVRLEAPPAHDLLPLPSARSLLLQHWAGRVLLAGLTARVLLALAALATGPTDALDTLRRLATAAVIVGGAVVLWRVSRVLRQRLLWRVRRKLILSYFFIGVVPAALIFLFFLIVGALTLLSFSSYLVKEKLADLQAQGRVYADMAAVELQQARTTAEARDLLARKVSAGARTYPGMSIALVPMNGAPRGEVLVDGAWDHGTAPTTLPEWLVRQGPSAVVIPVSDEAGASAGARLIVRSVSWLGAAGTARRAVVVDLPLDDAAAGVIREETGIRLGGIARSVGAGGNADPCAFAEGGEVRMEASPTVLSWVNFLDVTDWDTGSSCKLGLQIQPSLTHVYRRITEAQAIGGGMSFGQVLLGILLIIGSLFLVIQTVAFVMGVSLARSITGSIHELFEGTRRVQAEDLSHRIRVRTRDQFGALATSFNSMVETIEELLEQKVVKERLQQELQLARDIQTSLLPSETLRRGDVTLAAACRPAREIGGDYCDFFPLDDERIGLLVADVSGKGASAALYMAELKGLMLALSKTHQSPRALLGEVNRVLSANMGRTSFVTMTYAVLDLRRRTLTHARAGHTPLIHLRAGEAFPRTRLLAPEGLVLGVRMESVRSRFEGMLKEHTLTLAPGDVVVLFTDGISEAMNGVRDLYGEDRLCLCVEEHAALEPDALCDEIFESVHEFADGAEQHDDMTMIVLKVSAGAAVIEAGA